MPRSLLAPLTLAVALALGCGSATTSAAPPAPGATNPTATAAATPVRDWTRFGVDARRSNVWPDPTGITASNARDLRRTQIDLPGTVDSSPIGLRNVTVGGVRRDVLVVTTTYGRTLALDARSGARLWEFVPPGIESWEGSARITNTTPVADPGRAHVFAASPDGRIHKLRLADGREETAGNWPATLTRDPTHEKLASSLNLSGNHVIATTGGYIGDAPPYQGHVALIDRSSGGIAHVFNSLCSDRREIIVPSSCDASDAAIWGRAGAVVEPHTRNLLVTTGNAPFDGRRHWADSVLVLSPTARLLRNFTPRNVAELEATDADLGSTSPAWLAPGLAAQGGKEGVIRLIDLRRPNGTSRAGRRLGGERQTIAAPGRAVIVTAPAVLRRHRRTTMYATTGSGTTAYRLSRGRLRVLWSNRTAGTSPVLAGGLLYVYDLNGRLNVYGPATGRRVASLPAERGHWNSPVVFAGAVALPEGNANEHSTKGTLSLYRLP